MNTNCTNKSPYFSTKLNPNDTFERAAVATYIDPVAVSGVKRIPVLRVEVGEQFLDVSQASNLEFFRLLDYDLEKERGFTLM